MSEERCDVCGETENDEARTACKLWQMLSRLSTEELENALASGWSGFIYGSEEGLKHDQTIRRILELRKAPL